MAFRFALLVVCGAVADEVLAKEPVSQNGTPIDMLKAKDRKDILGGLSLEFHPRSASAWRDVKCKQDGAAALKDFVRMGDAALAQSLEPMERGWGNIAEKWTGFKPTDLEIYAADDGLECAMLQMQGVVQEQIKVAQRVYESSHCQEIDEECLSKLCDSVLADLRHSVQTTLEEARMSFDIVLCDYFHSFIDRKILKAWDITSTCKATLSMAANKRIRSRCNGRHFLATDNAPYTPPGGWDLKERESIENPIAAVEVGASGEVPESEEVVHLSAEDVVGVNRAQIGRVVVKTDGPPGPTASP